MPEHGGTLSGRDVRRLLALRRHLRVEIAGLSTDRRRRLLQAVLAARRARIPGPHDPPRELSTGEVLREFRWILNTLSLEEAEAATQALERLRHQPGRARRRA